MSTAAPLALRDGDRERLGRLARLPSVPSGLAKRARIVLLAADGVPNTDIARRVGASRPTVALWRARYGEGGVDALRDADRAGRPPKVNEVDVLIATLSAQGHPPPELGATHWSSRLLAAHLGVSFATVARIWRAWGVHPGTPSPGLPVRPPLPAGVAAVTGLHLGPSGGVLVVVVGDLTDDATATARAAEVGAASLLAALDRPAAPEGPRDFLARVAALHPGARPHVVRDDAGPGARDGDQVQEWLAAHPGVGVHTVPRGRSWARLVEVAFGLSGPRAVRHAAITPLGEPEELQELREAVRRLLRARGAQGRPLSWVKRQETSDTTSG
ncbi:helix-turn-helix domain-containing protein [Spongiactinospora sp. TRM90649]|uniref:helix-turn-helix domain-containing protein n=1 Tax=Spongiactinospora sp. TRM90649 TaxID=3031114 RepID=UPI0023FA15DD|nr:helix-turn-helix domain-containing protein [Spongiactinospora sp. TRM90649]MDF5757173.1 helix-turn-helix domain-containing protein [Spongiactinospora sp. TRM90649]